MKETKTSWYHGQWDHIILTMVSARSELINLFSVQEMRRQGHLLKGFKPVHWCTLTVVLLWLKLKLNTKIKFLHLSMWSFSAADEASPEILLARGTGQGWNLYLGRQLSWTLPANRAVCLRDDLGPAFVQRWSEWRTACSTTVLLTSTSLKMRWSLTRASTFT